MLEQVEIRPVCVEEMRWIRQQVLRPHQRVDEVRYEGEEDGSTIHLGAFLGVDLVGVAYLVHESMPEDGHGNRGGSDCDRCWRLRGMAVLPPYQQQGIGRHLLEMCMTKLRASGGQRLWCYARTPARLFYEKVGFASRGEEFEIEKIGPHVMMEREIAEGFLADG